MYKLEQTYTQVCILFVVCAADDIARVDYNDVTTPFAVTITDATGGSAVDGTDILLGSPSGATVRLRSILCWGSICKHKIKCLGFL